MFVNVNGWYDKQNVGDESYKEAFTRLFPDVSFVFSVAPLPNAAAYIVGGGDILTEELLRPFLLIDKPKHIMSVSFSRSFDKDLLSGFKSIIVRDNHSADIVRNIGLEPILCPDFSFVLTPNKTKGHKFIEEVFNKEEHDLYEKVIAIVINSHMIPEHGFSALQHSTLEKFCFDLAETIDLIPASFLFIPFGTKQPWDDRISNAIISYRCKYWKKNVLLYDVMKSQDVLDVISACDGVVSSRLHSSIFSSSCGVPFIDITFSHKNKMFLETLGYQKFAMSYEEFSKTKTVDMFNAILTDPSISQELSNIMSSYKLSLNEIIKTISIF